MFKVTPDDIPIYMQEGFEDAGIMLRFLVDSDKKEAFLVLEDSDAKNRDIEFEGNISSFVSLAEFHAIISGYDYHTNENVCFMVSFSQVEGRSVVEKVFDYNKSHISQLIAPNKSGDGNKAIPR